MEAAGHGGSVVGLGHQEAQGMFTLLLDEQLPERDQEALLQHLDGCEACEASFEKYSRAVTLVRQVERARVPADFTQRVMKRVRKRRGRQLFGLQGGRFFEHVSIPAEAAVPIILAAALVAALLFFAANP